MSERTNQTDRTRKAILETATEMLLGSTTPEEITMQAFADAAGVSHRTLYRYFDSRQELVEAVGAAYDESLDESLAVDVLSSFDTWTSNTDQLMEFGALHRDTFQRTLALSITSGVWRRDRDRAYWKLFRERFPHLPEQVARGDFAVLRHVLWASNAVLMGQRFEMPTEELAMALQRAVDALISAIDERDRAAAKERA